MNDSDKVKFKELIALITEEYGTEFTVARLRVWWKLFKGYSIEQFESAIMQHMSCPNDGKYPPKSGSLIRFLKPTERQLEHSLEDRAEMAWSCIQAEISRVGSYGSLELEDKQALAAVKSIGGWKKLCSLTVDKMVWAKKEFVDHYKCFERTPYEALPSKLPGRIEMQKANEQSLFKIQDLKTKLTDHQKKIEAMSEQERHDFLNGNFNK